MHITLRSSGWRFQIRIPRDIEPVFGRSPIRLNLGQLAKRPALRVARLLTGRAESVFMLYRKGASMTEDARDNLVEELHGLLLSVMDASESALQAAEQRRKAELEAVTLNLLTERSTEQQRLGKRLEALKGGGFFLAGKRPRHLDEGQKIDA